MISSKNTFKPKFPLKNNIPNIDFHNSNTIVEFYISEEILLENTTVYVPQKNSQNF